MREPRQPRASMGEPIDLATEAANAGLEAVTNFLAVRGHAPSEVIVMVDVPEPGSGGRRGTSGLGFRSSDPKATGDVATVVAALLAHARAGLRSIGQDMHIAPLPSPPGQG